MITPNKTAEILGKFPTATIYEAAGKVGDMSPNIRPIVPEKSLSGIAYTVKIFPNDTKAVILALEEAPKGSVLVIDAGGTNRSAVWGGSSSLVSSIRGIAGCVTNGSVRDVRELIKIGIPVYAAGISPRGTLKNHEGWSKKTISVGGVSISTGDYIIADEDGVLVVEASMGIKLCELAEKQFEAEHLREKRIKMGETLSTILGIEKSGN
ncbi:MAG: 4-hydroxy-4-methyl-2-oxoglutarate aldolase/4-carboxy-4-hydroxy-2-oxoadipate aldolase [Alphaproteobacteria bacterium MarineAlpha3_Bin7]|nr:MAG: 4-hydroxy-4-methyl-2-oxoglutarate aldolase/4-carboxy-4-hydroxy-2-oxoadipate aldolase [Alphaproteobacteria bacterium MarineAlpha3_Bin7]|tara:strand:- start:4426 stop:5052 length:627 start_codon:yes stop_codon:yes gene_type:complete